MTPDTQESDRCQCERSAVAQSEHKEDPLPLALPHRCFSALFTGAHSLHRWNQVKTNNFFQIHVGGKKPLHVPLYQSTSA